MSLELDNDSQELEKYGVWVKKAAPANEETPIEDPAAEDMSAESLVADLPDFDFIEDPAVEPELNEMPDFSDVMSEDFSIDEPVIEEASIDDFTMDMPAMDTAEETVTEDDSLDDFAIDMPAMEDVVSEEPAVEEPAVEEAATEDVSLDDFSIDMPVMEDVVSEEPAADDDFALPDMPEMSADDIFSEEFATTPEEAPVEEPVVEETPAEEAVIEEAAVDTSSADLDEPVFEDISLDNFETPVDETTLAPEVSIPEEPAEPAESEVFGDVSFEDVTSEITFEDASLDVPASDDTETETVDVPLDDFTLPTDDTTEISFDTDSGEPEISFAANTTEEVDIGDFLGLTDDLSEGTVSEELSFEDTGLRDFTTSEAVSLDDFMSAPQEEKNDIANDEPLDIELAFDDSFTGSTEASPEDQIETDLAAEPEADESFDVDDIFDSIQEVSFPGTETTEETPVVSSGEEISFDEVSEFDDLLGSLNDSANQPSDHENTSAASAASFTPSKPEVRDYDMTVNMDDSDEDDDFDEGSATVQATVTEQPAPEPAAEEPVAEETVTSEPELTEADIMTDDMKAVLAQLDEDFTEDTEETISQDSLDALTSKKEEPVMSDNTNNALLEKILSELTSLKDEISSIRADVDNLKAQKAEPVQAAIDEPAAEEPTVEETTSEEPAVEDEITIPPAEDTTSGGFFGDEDGDDTISLSGDELDNILNCANFTEEEAPSITMDEPAAEPAAENPFVEEPATEEAASEESFEIEEEPVTEEVFVTETDESADFYEDADVGDSDELTESFSSMDQALEEPVIDEFDLNEPAMEEGGDELPDEIEIPQMDDGFIVESSSTDFLDGMEEEKSIADSITDQNASFLSSDENIDSMTEELGNEEEVLEVAENNPLEEAEEFTEPVTVELSDSAFPTEEDIGLVGTEDSEYADEEIDTTPTEEVFGKEQWPVMDDAEDIFVEEPAVEEPVVEEPAVEEPVVEEPTVEEPVIEEPAVEDEPVAEEEEEQVAEEEPVVEEEPVAEDEPAVEEEPAATEEPVAEPSEGEASTDIPDDLKEDVKSVLKYMDQLLENLPEEKIAEFARSEHFDVYKKLFTELGLA